MKLAIGKADAAMVHYDLVRSNDPITSSSMEPCIRLTCHDELY